MTDLDRARVLWLPGVGGPNPGIVTARLADRVDLTWIYNPADLFDQERDVGAMRQSGGTAIAVTCDEEMLDAAVAAHSRSPVQAIVTMSEGLLPVAARIAEKLGLPFNSVECVQRLTDKAAQRDALSSGGVPVPRYRVVEDGVDLAEVAEAVGFPAVLKPVRGGGSMLTFGVSDLGELRRAWATAKSTFAHEPDRSTALLHQPGSLRMVAESLLVGGGDWFQDPRLGDYLSVDTAVFDGTFNHLITMDKLPLAERFRETGCIGPSTLRPDQLASVHEMTEAALAAIGVTQGMCHTELKLTAEGPRIIEVNGRPGGITVGMLDIMSGYDLVWQLARQALGAGPAEHAAPLRTAGFLCPCLPASLSGERLSVTWLDDFSALPGFREFYDLGVTSFDVNVGGGWAAFAYVEGGSAGDVLGLADHLRDCLIVERVG
jgi:biotin carboxylase